MTLLNESRMSKIHPTFVFMLYLLLRDIYTLGEIPINKLLTDFNQLSCTK